MSKVFKKIVSKY